MTGDAARRMDKMYRHQRHIYDLTRKFYLLGRDRLLADLDLRPGQLVCEVGCGTARNLIWLARRYPGVGLFGMDASAAMLDTAAAQIAAAGLSDRIVLRQGLAEDLDPAALFGLDQPFDAVVLSFVLSMIPPWRAALTQSLRCVAPDGTLAVVDFGDQSGLPRWFRAVLHRWLALFDVTPRAELMAQLLDLASGDGSTIKTAAVFGGYAHLVWIARARAPVSALGRHVGEAHAENAALAAHDLALVRRAVVDPQLKMRGT
jgi:S-adenosylmethionine-diacylgycerolhomoserine-N-methlytransferase